jgi:hypothetical protein
LMARKTLFGQFFFACSAIPSGVCRSSATSRAKSGGLFAVADLSPERQEPVEVVALAGQGLPEEEEHVLQLEENVLELLGNTSAVDLVEDPGVVDAVEVVEPEPMHVGDREGREVEQLGRSCEVGPEVRREAR